MWWNLMWSRVAVGDFYCTAPCIGVKLDRVKGPYGKHWCHFGLLSGILFASPRKIIVYNENNVEEKCVFLNSSISQTYYNFL